MSYSKIKIVGRLRPAIPGEQHDKAVRVIHADSGDSIRVDNPRDPSQAFNYPFTSCYDENSEQHEIFDRDVKPLLDLVFTGLTVTIFAYGVTSSGKTHTMQGNKENPGIIPRAVETLFNHKDSMYGAGSVSLEVSYMEIYKDEVYDLLVDRETAAKLPVREDGVGKVFVANLTRLPIEDLQDFDQTYSRANKQRSVGATNLNRASSRSHAILTLHIAVTDPVQNITLCGCLNLVDLAGSENNKLTGNDSSRMAESSAINKSLSVLGQVVHALNQGASRIPYRNSKLTRILQDALGGNSIGLLICNLAPGTKFRQDTLNTLNFAVRTKNIENKPVVNQGAAAANVVAGPSMPAVRRPSLAVRPPLAGRSALPQPRAARPSITAVSIAQVTLPPPVLEARPATLAMIGEEEMKAQIAKAVEVEVARRFAELTRQQEEAAAAAAQRSMEDSRRSSESLQSIPSGVLTPLLKRHRELDDELKQRLEELEQKFERGNKEGQMADVLSPISRKKTGRAYVALARAHSEKNNLALALELYRKAEACVPDNVKLKERWILFVANVFTIIEIEWAVKHNVPFNPSPKRRKSHSKRPRPARSARRGGDGSPAKEKENRAGATPSPRKRVVKHEYDGEEDEGYATPPKRRRLVKTEEE